MTVKIGEIYHTEADGRTFYVQVQRPPVSAGDPNTGKREYVFVSTRTLYATSVYGQIEQAGWINKDRLMPLKNTKKDRGIRKQITRVRHQGIERSQLWYELEKARSQKEGSPCEG